LVLIVKYKANPEIGNPGHSLVLKPSIYPNFFIIMNRGQINKSRMYFATNMVLEKYSSLTAGFPEFIEAHERFKSKLSAIDENRQVQEADTTGLTLKKTGIRQNIVRQILQISAALQAYATVTKDLVLKNKATYSNTDLIRAADPVLCDIGHLLLSLATPLRNELQRFFVNQKEYDELAENLNQFKLAIPQKRVATGTSKVSTGNIGQMFETIDLLLKQELDVLMLPFQFTNLNFYQEYKNARLIIGYNGGRSSAVVEEPATP